MESLPLRQIQMDDDFVRDMLGQYIKAGPHTFDSNRCIMLAGPAHLWFIAVLYHPLECQMQFQNVLADDDQQNQLCIVSSLALYQMAHLATLLALVLRAVKSSVPGRVLE